MQSRDSILPTKLTIAIDDNSSAATDTVTSNNTNVSNNDTVTVNGRVYTFKTTLTGAVDEVLIGADADTSLTNLRTLINSGRAEAKATAALTSDQTNITAADTVTIGSKTYTFKAALTEAKAVGTLTSDNTNPSDGETVTIDTITYTFKSVLPSGSLYHTPYEVLIGATADTTLGNLEAAINNATGEGTKYSFNTPVHPTVTCGDVSSHAVVITAKSVGTAGNSIATTETSAHLSFGGSTLASGANSVANEVFKGADADTSLANLAAAVNGSTGSGTLYSSSTVASTEVSSGVVTAHAITLTALTAGTAANSFASTETSTHLSFGGTVFTGGVVASTVNADVTCGAVTAHAVVLTAITAGYAGNSLTLAKSAATLSLTAGTFAGGGATLGTALVGQEGGILRQIISIAPDWAGTPTYTLALLDADGIQYYVTGNLNENATTNTDIADLQIAPEDTVKITTSAKVEETKSITIELR